MPQGLELPPFLPMSKEEAAARGWRKLDIIFVSGDAYVDHPSFPSALLGRMLEAQGFSVGIIARPRPGHPEDVAKLGKPRLFFAVAPGCVDSMICNYTAQKRKRHSDSYAPGGKGGGRPNRTAIVYCNMIRQIFGKDAAILVGGVEVSLRRFAHYDFWDDAVRRPILLDAPADALVYGMGEKPLLAIARGMKSRRARTGANPSEELASLARSIESVVYRTPASEKPPAGYKALPSVEEISEKSSEAQVRAFMMEMRHRTDGVYQDCAGHRVIANPPVPPMTTEEMDAVYNLSFVRRAHPSYTENIPALEQVQFSVTSHRGCCGGCAFCGIGTHQGKTIQSRSHKSILHEVEILAAHPDFKGTIRDIGGATANMWGLRCTSHKECKRPSCLVPEVCRYFETNQGPYVKLLEAARRVPGVQHLFISSGIRMDLALRCEPFVEAFARYYVSGHAKVAPEHIVPEVLRVMMKPSGDVFREFARKFRQASTRVGKKQYVLPYFIAAHPGSRMEDMVAIAMYLKRENVRVEQCQIFTPIPGTASAIMYATGINPFDGRPVFVERNMRRRDMQKALVLWHLPESVKLVREALALCGLENEAASLIPQRRLRSKPGMRRNRGRAQR